MLNIPMRVLRPAAVAALAVVAVHASAAQRTFVSSNGNDFNVCSIAFPCRSFGRAITQTDVGGEIIALDSAGYGPVTVNKAVSIIAPPGIYAGISVFAGDDGIVVNGPGIRVRLEGLSINGLGGTRGINNLNSSLLSVARCSISNMALSGINSAVAGGVVEITDTTATKNYGQGLAVAGTGTTVTVVRSQFNNNVNGGILVNNGAIASIVDSVANANATTGILVSASAGSTTRASVSRSVVSGNGLDGATADGVAAGDTAMLDIAHSTVQHNAGLGVGATSGGGTSSVFAMANVISDNGLSGIAADGANTSAVATGNTVTRNGTGIAGINGGTAYSGGDNSYAFNTARYSGAILNYAHE
jgi:hypothetical protein